MFLGSDKQFAPDAFPAVVHPNRAAIANQRRVAAIAAGGLDALLQNGAVVTLLAVCRLTHRQAYGDIFMVASIGPILATVVVVALAS